MSAPQRINGLDKGKGKLQHLRNSIRGPAALLHRYSTTALGSPELRRWARANFSPRESAQPEQDEGQDNLSRSIPTTESPTLRSARSIEGLGIFGISQTSEKEPASSADGHNKVHFPTADLVSKQKSIGPSKSEYSKTTSRHERLERQRVRRVTPAGAEEFSSKLPQSELLYPQINYSTKPAFTRKDTEMNRSFSENSQRAASVGFGNAEAPGAFKASPVDRTQTHPGAEQGARQTDEAFKMPETDENDGKYINFYDGHGRRVGRKHINDCDDEGEREMPTVNKHSDWQGAVDAAVGAQPQSNDIAGTSFPSLSPLVTDTTDAAVFSSDALLEALLEEQYRGQAETFSRASSRASSRQASNSQVASPTAPSVASSSRNISPLVRNGSLFTPTRAPSHSFASVQRSQARTPSSNIKTVLEPFRVRVKSEGSTLTKSSPNPEASPYSTYGHRLRSVPASGSPTIAKRPSRIPEPTRGFFYFTDIERERIESLVHAEARSCERHTNCTDCINTEYAYYENKTMPTSMPPEERQKIINNNRALRNIKNELENLAAEGVISDDAYDVIMRTLPAEAPLSSATRVGSSAVSSSASTSTAVDGSPPSYNSIHVPTVPSHSQPPTKPEIACAIALYRYSEPDDCCLEVGDNVSVLLYNNADWWTGKNMRTGKEGVFPASYVQLQANYSTPSLGAKAQFPNSPALFQQQQASPAPGPSNPYDASAPPMVVANGPGDGRQPSNGSEMGKKFGKRLGNAAIFGAGASLGGNLVNSIF